MVQTLILTLIMTAFLSLPSAAFAFRCGSDIVDVGDLKIEVFLACGEPLSKEVVGYIDQVRYTTEKSYSDVKSGDAKEREERIRVMVIEEWIIKESDNYYSLLFEGNKLKEIERANR